MVRVEPFFFAIIFLTPLVIFDDELDEGLEVMTACLASVSSQVATH